MYYLVYTNICLLFNINTISFFFINIDFRSINMINKQYSYKCICSLRLLDIDSRLSLLLIDIKKLRFQLSPSNLTLDDFTYSSYIHLWHYTLVVSKNLYIPGLKIIPVWPFRINMIKGITMTLKTHELWSGIVIYLIRLYFRNRLAAL